MPSINLGHEVYTLAGSAQQQRFFSADLEHDVYTLTGFDTQRYIDLLQGGYSTFGNNSRITGPVQTNDMKSYFGSFDEDDLSD